MEDIVVIGCGSQSVRHLKCLAKLRETHPSRIVALVDPCQANTEKCRQALDRYGFDSSGVVCTRSVADARRKLELSSAIVDVVTPNPFHYRVAAEAVDLGASRLVIEKPLAHKLSEAKAFLKLKCQICVLENYLFSDVTNYLRETIHADGLRPQFVKSEFSKDRRVDSANGRGSAHGTLPHVFTVELPHQVAVVGHVLGSIGKVTDAWHHDMILPDGRIADHGEGAITLMHDDSVPSYNFSCLQGFRHTSACYRSLKVYCADDVNVFGFYSTTVDLDGSVLVYRRNRLLKRKLLKDDSLKNGLRDSLDCLRFKRESLASLKFGIDVLRVIEAGQRVAKRTP